MSKQFTFAIWSNCLLLIFVPYECCNGALFSDGFDGGQPLSNNWVVAQQSDSYAAVANYSSFNLQTLFGIGSGTPISVPEAPHSAEVGGPSTTGVVFAANATSGVASAVNLISKSSFNVPQFTLQFDLYTSTGPAALQAQNDTELAVWAVGRSSTSAVGYANRTTAGDGTWGWLVNDNGLSSGDATLFKNTTQLTSIADTASGAGALFDSAFGFDYSLFQHHSPLYEWVTVQARYDGSVMHVSFNGIEFLSAITSQPSGRIAVGYADPFASISSSPDVQFGIIDNVLLIQVPEPTSGVLAILGISLAGLSRRRRWTT